MQSGVSITSGYGLGRGVVVHCTSGRRRTGTFLAGYLIAAGEPCDRALERILSANPAVELREAQIEFLKTFAASCEFPQI